MFTKSLNLYTILILQICIIQIIYNHTKRNKKVKKFTHITLKKKKDQKHSINQVKTYEITSENCYALFDNFIENNFKIKQKLQRKVLKALHQVYIHQKI